MTIELFPYQRQGVDWLLEKSEPRYIAWEPGLGKTALAVSAADAWGAQRVLVLSPAHGRENWRREVETWQKINREVHVVHNTGREQTFTGPCVVVVSYNGVSLATSRIRHSLLEQSWDLLVLDEAHMLGNESERTRFVLGPFNGLYQRAKRVLPLSGTPATKSASELYPVFRALWPHVVAGKSWTQWEDKYCRVITRRVKGKNQKGYPKGKEIRQVVGTKPDKLPELRSLVRPVMSILRTDDVLKDIPPLRVVTYPLAPEDLPASLKPVGNAARSADKKLRAMLASHAHNTLAAIQLLDAEFATERRLIGEAKAPLVAEILETELLQDPLKKVVVFAIHRQVVDTLCTKLDRFGVVCVDGRTRDKVAQQDKFQTDPQTRVFVGQIQAAGTNLTLTAARDVVLVECSWKPGENFQAIRRCRRIGQNRPVLARYMTLVGADEHISKVLIEREQELSGMFENERRAG